MIVRPSDIVSLGRDIPEPPRAKNQWLAARSLSRCYIGWYTHSYGGVFLGALEGRVRSTCPYMEPCADELKVNPYFVAQLGLQKARGGRTTTK